MSTRFQVEMSKALQALIPSAPLSDILVIKDIARKRHLRHLPAEIGAWLAVTTHVRHNHTDYDTLLDEGYDSDSARHFVLDDMNDVLRSWRSTRLLDGDEEDEVTVIRRHKPDTAHIHDDDDAFDDEPE
jgi:hypothetical protein